MQGGLVESAPAPKVRVRRCWRFGGGLLANGFTGGNGSPFWRMRTTMEHVQGAGRRGSTLGRGCGVAAEESEMKTSE
jgi:hypothetical protein